MKKLTKKSIVELAKKAAFKSVGRSIPFVVHEPKVPDNLKKQ